MTTAVAPSVPGTAFGRMLRQLAVDTGFTLIGLVVSVASFALIITGLCTGAGLLVLTIGLPILALTMLIARMFADLNRVGIRAVLRRPSPRPIYPAPPESAGWIRRMVNPLFGGQSWLDITAGVIDLPFAIIAFTLTITWWSAAIGGLTYGLWQWSLPNDPSNPGGVVIDNEPLSEVLGFGTSTSAEITVNAVIGLFFLLTLPLVVRGAALMRAYVLRALLCGVAELRRQIVGLQEQKQAAVSAEATALRRLERDIHDGPQQRLVRLAMDLGRARQQIDTDPESARTTIDEALGQARETLDELRALSRGIAPPILTDRGLASALAALAARSPVPVDLVVDPDLGRLDPGVESTAYFVVAEAFTNVAKHSAATRCTATVARASGFVGISVGDDGVGGASIAKGHGLAGLADRVLASDGTLRITSPIGGPTEIRVELPCG
jgi:signal transduction histidine kinase